MNGSLFRKHYNRIAKEGVFKAFLGGISIASGVLLLTALICWFSSFKAGLFLAIGAFVLALAISVPLLYIYRYRPTVKTVASRVDELGLEERVLTMTELKDDDSFIAKAQRADTEKALRSVDHLFIKLAISTSLIVLSVVGIIVGLFGGVTFSSLYYADVIPDVAAAFTPTVKPAEFFVRYGVDEGGFGGVYLWTEDAEPDALVPVEEEYTVIEGDSAPAIIAVPAANYVFCGWSDGLMDPYRHDLSVTDDIEVKALFERIASLPDPTVPFSPNSNSNDSQSSPDRGDPSDQPPQSEPSEPSDGDDNGDGAGGRRDSANQQVNDGSTFYGDVFDENYNETMEYLGSNDSMPDDLKGDIADYYGSIEKNGDSGEDGDGSANGD